MEEYIELLFVDSNKKERENDVLKMSMSRSGFYYSKQKIKS